MGAATTQQHAIRLVQAVRQVGGQQAQRIGFHHGAGHHLEPLCIGLDQGSPTGPALHRQQPELRPQAKGLQADAARAGPKVPEHSLIR